MTDFSRDEESDPPHSEPDLVEVHYERSGSELCSWIRRKYGSAVDAEDVKQQTFLSATRFRESFEKAPNAKAYLFTIARNTVNKGFGSKRKEEEAERIFDQNCQDNSGLHLYEGWQYEDILVIAENTLSERQMVYFRKVCLDKECTLRQLAEQWNHSYEYMKQYALRARSKLRDALRKEFQAQEETY
jgi:RNA polymerase sigma factor (sigma-70 family)